MKCLQDIEGMGPKKILLFQKLGIYNLDDFITYYPIKYNIIKRSNMKLVQNGDKVIIDGIVEGKPTVIHLSLKLKKVIFRISNSQSIYNISVYNQLYLCKELHYGMSVTVFGKYDRAKNTIVANEVRMGHLPEQAQIEAIYSTTEGLNRNIIGKMIQEVLKNDISVMDYIPDYLKVRYHFPLKLWSIREIHHPSNVTSYKRALQRLKYEEFFLYLLKIHYLRKNLVNDSHAIVRTFDESKLNSFISRLKFELTPDQILTVNDIKKDLVSKKRMNRLIQGDVGSGKTIVALLSCYINFLSGYQTAFMVPTEILANQHFQNALELFQDTGMNIGLLTASVKKKDREVLYHEIANGNLHLIIGTQSLIQEKVKYHNLGLIITDEQHRFGVNQRNELRNKGTFPDILSMSATPIPRTYALTIYGDMDISSIKTKPAGRCDVITYFKQEKNILDVLNLMKKELVLGHQIYVIAPSISSEHKDELDNVVLLKEKMELAFGKIATIGMVHGKLSSDKKNEVMRDFETHKISILISTTVIEVGVNVPNASMIVVFNANLFGLSTLHQLRGRVGRGNIQSYCVLIAKEYNERLKLLEQTNDGFKISEYDFKCRGEGDLFGVRQSGEAHFKLANIKKDFELLVRVRQDVDEFFECYFMEEKYEYLWEYLNSFSDLN